MKEINLNRYMRIINGNIYSAAGVVIANRTDVEINFFINSPVHALVYANVRLNTRFKILGI